VVAWEKLLQREEGIRKSSSPLAKIRLGPDSLPGNLYGVQPVDLENLDGGLDAQELPGTSTRFQYLRSSKLPK